MKVIEEFLTCDCSTEGLLLRYGYENARNEDEPDWLDISIWEQSPIQKWNVWQRLKYCWHVVRTGNPYKDQVMLDLDQVIRLHHFCDVVLARGVISKCCLEIERAGEID